MRKCLIAEMRKFAELPSLVKQSEIATTANLQSRISALAFYD